MKLLSSLIISILIFGCTPSKKDKSREKPELVSNGARINYNIYGDGDTTLLFVHGWCIDQSYWKYQVDHFKEKYKVVTLDLPGHGDSGKNRNQWTIESFGDDVSMVINALDLENLVLIGHSMGGNIILEATKQNQDRLIGFVGVDNFKQVGAEYTDEQIAEYAGFISMLKEDFKSIAGGFAEGMLFSEATDSETKEKVMSDVLGSNPGIAVPILESLMETNVKERGLLQLMHLKVHLINSDVIPTNVGQLEKYCSSYEVHSIGPTGHYPMIEEPDRFNDILEDILANL